MQKSFKTKLLVACIGSLFLASNVQGANRKEEIKIPIQLKEKRIKELEKIADEKISDEDYPDYSKKELLEIIEKMNFEEEVVNGKFANENIKKQYRTIQVSTNPSENFQVLNLAPNFSTTLIFVDKLGNPWTIEKFIVGSSENYYPEIQDTNIITFTPKIKADNSNLTVIFKNGDVNTAISFNLNINNEVVDFISEITIDGYGDNSPKETEVTHINTNETLGNNKLLYLSKNEQTFMSEMIANTLPEGFKEMYAYGTDGKLKEDYRVFYKDGEKFLYVRTIHEIVSPDVTKQRNGIDKNIKILKIPYTTSLITREFGMANQIYIKNK